MAGTSRLPMDFAVTRRQASMIVSHEHKFIFLKTKKTAGTSIELALSQLCGPDDVITPLTEIDEALRASGRGAQNWRLHGWWGSPRPLLAAPLVQIHRRGLRLLQSHAGGGGARAAQRRQSVAELFQIRLRPQPVGPAGLVLSPPLSARDGRRRPSPASSTRTAARGSTITTSIRSTGTSRSISSAASRASTTTSSSRSIRSASASPAQLPRAKSTFRRGSAPYRDYYDDETREIVARWYAREIEFLDYQF